MKRVLIISYLFPPKGGIGVQRAVKFVKYLPRFGWQPTVLTPRNPDCGMLDTELVEDIPTEARVVRTHTVEPVRALRFLISLVDRIRISLCSEKSGATVDFDGTPRSRYHSKLDTFLFIPDNRIGWIPFALSVIVKLRRLQRFDAILSTSPPFSVHLVGLLAKRILKKPWVVDFRDLWILGPYKRPPTKVHLFISRRIERKVLESADKVITVSEPLGQDLMRSYPDISPEKFGVIPNGYDAEDFKRSDPPPDDKFTIAHVGNLHWFSGRNPYYFLRALSDLKREFPEVIKDMDVVFVGAADALNKAINSKIVSKYHLRDTVRFVDFVSHSKAVTYMRSCSVLLFIPARSYAGCGSSRGNISGKLYEYFASGKPILALTEEGPVREFVRKSGCGILVGYEDIRGIKEAILTCYRRYKEGKLKPEPNWTVINRFERERLTEQLADVLNRLCNNA